ncbi:MAG: hypothetical protein F2893_03040 [Actinobacteria bacterium]|uniref:Unannotated protein n=1 Tax=freshwater metagenome TaxID=449393 RepID=A0A6J7U5R3_9ZZZZ|nr:hypothetical protein [Actinomycetota bacterium]MTH92398.1 hypothetical protein [Actinomycetota bacterium]
MNSYMVVASFKEGVTQDQIRALVPAEQDQAKLLEERGLLGFIKVAMPRKTVFIEAFGQDDKSVLETIHSLPLAILWDIDVFQTTPPAGSSV